MNPENKKPFWLWIYYVISFVPFIFGLYIILTDKTGFGILIAGPLILVGVLLAIASYFTYRSKKNNKRVVANSILWPLFLVSTSILIYEIIQIITWFKVVGFQGWPGLLGELIVSILLLILIIVLNKRNT